MTDTARTRLPPPMMAALEHAASIETAGNGSALLRAIVAEGLERRGLWPPQQGNGEAPVMSLTAEGPHGAGKSVLLRRISEALAGQYEFSAAASEPNRLVVRRRS